MRRSKPGRLVELRKSDILIPEYQRELDERRVKRMAREFDWFLFGTLYIAQRTSPNVTTGGIVEPPGYYVVDGQHRLAAARLLTDVDMLPGMSYDFAGPQHEAEVYVMLQRARKPLVTTGYQNAELIAGGEFGRVARVAQDLVDTLHCETVPLASIRKLAAAKPEALARLAPFLDDFVGTAALLKDFLEGAVYLEDDLGEDDSLVGPHLQRLHDIGYERIVAGMIPYLKQMEITTGKSSKTASPKQKAQALRSALFDGGERAEAA